MPTFKAPCTADATCATSTLQDTYYGDLRKGAYLRRRAAYRLQTATALSNQVSQSPQPGDTFKTE